MIQTGNVIDGWYHSPCYRLKLDNGATLVLFGTVHIGLPHAYVYIQSQVDALRSIAYQVVMEGKHREKNVSSRDLNALSPRNLLGLRMIAGVVEHCGLVLERDYLQPSRVHGDLAIDLPHAERLSLRTKQPTTTSAYNKENTPVHKLYHEKDRRLLTRLYIEAQVAKHVDGMIVGLPSIKERARDIFFAEILLSYLLETISVVGVFGSNHIPGIISLVAETLSIDTIDVAWIPVRPPPEMLLELLP